MESAVFPIWSAPGLYAREYNSPFSHQRRRLRKKKKSNCQTKKEKQDQIWSRVPKGGPIPRRTGRPTVGRKKNSNCNQKSVANQLPVWGEVSMCDTAPTLIILHIWSKALFYLPHMYYNWHLELIMCNCSRHTIVTVFITLLQTQ
jgi:hypothetical protein